MDAETSTGAGEDLSTKRVFTTGEAAAVCKVSQQTIIRCFDSGRLSGFRVPGSKFRRIPREELIRFMKANNIPLDQLTGGGRRRILIVDDDPAIIEVYREIFGRDDRYEVRTATNGYDAGLYTEQFKPHLVILDYMLPDIRGDHVCRRIRENPSLSQTRVLCVSGAASEPEFAAIRAAGAVGYVKKPFKVDELLATVGRVLGVESEGAASNGAA